MKSLKYNLREIVSKKYNKRAICNSSVVLEVLDEAQRQKIKNYGLIYICNEKTYTVGYETDYTNDTIYYTYREETNPIERIDSIDDIKQRMNYNKDITIVREYQSDDTNLGNPNLSSGDDMNAVASVVASMVNQGTIGSGLNGQPFVEVSIHDNFILKKYFVTEKDERFNYNLSGAQINEFIELRKQSKEVTKQYIILSIVCIAIIVIIIILAFIFGE